MELQPIIKWAGGKRWLVRKASDLFPSEYGNYVEPFLGGAAVYFHLAPSSALLSDVNSELINVYSSIKKDWKLVADLLKTHQLLHCSDYYYQVRSDIPKSRFAQAARTLYLNRTCWNGLYRVNLKGEFNVPIGTKSNVLADIDSFPHVAKLLKGARFRVGDFEASIDAATDGDFVFVDPPYTVKHNFNGFIKYNENLFKWEDQVRLRDAVTRATNRGVKVLVLNANHESISSLYDGFEQIVLSRSNVLSGKSEFRGVYQELAIRCWQT
ncbi:DNA adenine methylase [Stutzerimonas nitrititolerans]|uniref:DNA adenine methylase n=1 Tax=Stutzerimonas nitrititolerans TaxID=2482751 RepID=UPI00289EB0EF|nr:Dam family site-specific DNA-(adenine-N6)-methyltransferase [Stutzerimonas nitrititolerans]